MTVSAVGAVQAGRTWTRVLVVVLLLLVVQTGSLIRPAWACGCGAMVVDSPAEIGVDNETSVVSWDGKTEEIVMSLTVRGNAPEAAWIMPVPSRATVKLGDAALFRQLERVIAPVHRTRHHFWPKSGDWPLDDSDEAGDAAPMPGAEPPVGVVGRERLGPFDVARLTASDPAALSNWLSDNGFSMPPRLGEALRPYVAEKWEYVAVKLAPAGGGKAGKAASRQKQALQGKLDPLRLRFASERVVYPMRLSKLAKNTQTLQLYVLADHRMATAGTIGGGPQRIGYAGRLTPKSVPAGPLREELGGRSRYLTAIGQYFPMPEQINGDHELVRADTDQGFQEVEYRDELATVLGIPAWMLTVGGGLVLLVAAVLLLVRRRQKLVRRTWVASSNS